MTRMQALIFGTVVLIAMTKASTEAVPNSGLGQHFIGEGLPHEDCPIIDDARYAVHLPYFGDCSKYYSCRSGLAYLMSCPENLHWSQLTYRCDYPEKVQCSIRDKLVPNGRQSKYFFQAVPANCNMFMKCEAFLCPPSLHWNAALQRCDLPHLTQCDIMIQLAPPLSGGGSTNVYPAPIAPTPYNQASASNGSNDDALQGFNKLCNNYNEQFLRYPGDCTKFIHCNGFAFVHSCPDNLLWNAELKTCDRFCK